jgi:hypothetical protein
MNLRSALARVYFFWSIRRNLLASYRHSLFHRRVTCEECQRRVRFSNRDWEWAVTNFAVMCRGCQAHFEANQYLEDRQCIAFSAT